MINIDDDIELAVRGKKIFEKMKGSYMLEDDVCIVVFPEEDIELQKTVLDNLKEFLERKYLSMAYIIHANDCAAEKTYITSVKMSGIEINSLIKLFRLVQFHKNVIIASVSEPFYSGNIIGNEGISLVDYVKDGLLV